MNGQGKSDRPAVPGKSLNNAGRPVAEGINGTPAIVHPFVGHYTSIASVGSTPAGGRGGALSSAAYPFTHSRPAGTNYSALDDGVSRVLPWLRQQIAWRRCVSRRAQYDRQIFLAGQPLSYDFYPETSALASTVGSIISSFHSPHLPGMRASYWFSWERFDDCLTNCRPRAAAQGWPRTVA